jgi:hypothetical protein
VFVRIGTTWNEQAELSHAAGESGDFLGGSVAVSGDAVVAGAYLAAVGNTFQQGAAYLFVRTGTTWNEQAELSSDNGSSGDGAGTAVAVDGNTSVIGAPGASVGTTTQQGIADVYVFLAAGSTCVIGSQCSSGFCVDGVCCDMGCGNSNPSDCQACSTAAGGAANGRCSVLPAGTQCQAPFSGGEPASMCSGQSPDCPPPAAPGMNMGQAPTGCSLSSQAAPVAELLGGLGSLLALSLMRHLRRVPARSRKGPASPGKS